MYEIGKYVLCLKQGQQSITNLNTVNDPTEEEIEFKSKQN